MESFVYFGFLHCTLPRSYETTNRSECWLANESLASIFNVIALLKEQGPRMLNQQASRRPILSWFGTTEPVDDFPFA